jgi:GR25 family glycosyltransferase involved in LPS biosynthesis
MPFIGRYINMDASTDRRVAMEAQFERFGCADRYERFPGVDGRTLDRAGSTLSVGELGCFMAHYRCLLEADVEDHHVHILEDDVEFAPQTFSLLNQMIGDAMNACDMLFTDIFVPADMTALFNLVGQYRHTGLFEQRREPPAARMPRFIMYPGLHNVAFGGATSYIVQRDARPKLLALLEEEIARGPSQPIDMVYRRLANDGRITARCSIPFITSISADSICDTTIVGRSQDADSAMAFYALRSFFYVARDDDRLQSFMGEINGALADPDYLGPMAEFFRFLFSDRFKPF